MGMLAAVRTGAPAPRRCATATDDDAAAEGAAVGGIVGVDSFPACTTSISSSSRSKDVAVPSWSPAPPCSSSGYGNSSSGAASWRGALPRGDSSDSLCGGSPTSTMSGSSSAAAAAALQLCTTRALVAGESPPAAAQRPRRQMLRWLASRVAQLQRKAPPSHELGALSASESCATLLELPQQQQQQQRCRAGPVQGFARAVLRPVVRLARAAAAALAAAGPQGPGTNDTTRGERVLNVLTSLPFCALGAHGLRVRRCPRGRQFSWAFLMVGAVAAAYHGVGASHPARPLLRKADYVSIAFASGVLRRAAHVALPRPLALAALLAAPLKPTLVTGANLAAVELKFVRCALAHAHLRPSWGWHLGTAAAGLAAFFFEDAAIERRWPPLLHSLWHSLSAVAMGTSHALLGHLEAALLLEGVTAAALL